MPTQISRNSTGEIPNAVLLERIAIRFGCQHGLRLTYKVELVWYYNALSGILVPRRGDGSASRHQRLALTLQYKANVSFWFLQQA
jgi:hypothetical protein